MDWKEFILKYWKTILLFIICWSIGFYTLRVTAIRLDLDKAKDIDNTLILFFLFSIGMILLPFLKTLKIGKILELEREITETKQELKETKTELRQSISLALSSINTSISSLNNSINITVPGVEEMRKEVEKLQSQKESISKKSLEDELDELISDNEGDLNFALAKDQNGN